MAERNLHVDHATIWRWVQRYAPESDRRCRRELRTTNGSWRVDETYLRVAGRWTYLYRTVDSAGAKGDIAGQVAFVSGLLDSLLLPNSVTSAGHHSRACTLAALPVEDTGCCFSEQEMQACLWQE
jgi:hypothetical protein